MKTKKEQILAWVEGRGVVRPSDLAGLGISPNYLAILAREGSVRKVGRGLYASADHPITESHGLVQAVSAQTGAVVCLLSALAFHQVGTQLPYQAWLSVPYGTRLSKAAYPPRRVIVMRSSAYAEGIEHHDVEGVRIPVYSIAKTVADCFKFRNKVGLDVAIEALREVLAERRCSRDELRTYARTDRVEKIMSPYMEALP